MSKIISTRYLYFSLLVTFPLFTACSVKNNTIPEAQETSIQKETSTEKGSVEKKSVEKESIEQNLPKDETTSMTNNNSSETSTTDNNQPPSPPKIQNNTKRLVEEGILEEVPSAVTVGEEFTITFRTMYPNGCWMQSEPNHDLNTETKTITHTYTTSYEAEGRMCTMGFKQGGFQAKLISNKTGTFEGKVFVDDNLRVSYTIDVISK